MAPTRGPAQKTLTKTLLNPGITSIQIDGGLCYEVYLETAQTAEVAVEARMEGEYRSDLLVQLKEAGSTLYIEPIFSPEFRLPNDKLGAHKVVSVSLKVILPVDENVVLNAGTCQVATTGRYRNLEIVFNDGGCRLEHTAENTEVRTASASIWAHLRRGEVEARSRYGQVLLDSIPPGDHHVKLTSARGNITVRCCP